MNARTTAPLPTITCRSWCVTHTEIPDLTMHTGRAHRLHTNLRAWLDQQVEAGEELPVTVHLDGRFHPDQPLTVIEAELLARMLLRVVEQARSGQPGPSVPAQRNGVDQ